MIVEDQVMFLQLLRSILEAMPGLQVVATATRQADAIALCSGDDAPDLLILDLALPDGDGLAVAERGDARPDPVELLLRRERRLYHGFALDPTVALALATAADGATECTVLTAVAANTSCNAVVAPCRIIVAGFLEST